MRFGVRGRSPGQLQRPTGVTVDMNGDIIVADYDNHWISIFSSDGKFKVRKGLLRTTVTRIQGSWRSSCSRMPRGSNPQLLRPLQTPESALYLV